MAAPVAVESQGQPREPRRQQVEPRLELAPQRHEPEVRDVAVDEREDTTRLIVRVEPDRPGPPSTAFDRQTYFRPIPPLLDRFDDLRVGDVELADASQGVAHDGLLGGELGVVAQVLQLAAAAAVAHVMGARRRDPGRTGPDDLGQLAAREMFVELHAVAQPDPLARCGAGNEDGAAVGEAAHAVAPGGDGGDRDHLAHPPMLSRRATRSQGDAPSGAAAADAGGAAAVRCCSASSAAAIASGWASSGANSAARSRWPTRSK